MAIRRLLNTNPQLYNPELAAVIGLNEAIVLKQVQYWTDKNRKIGRNFRKGHYWTYNTYEEWQKQFPFWSVRTIKRIFKRLEDKGYLVSDNFNKMKADRTKWYRIPRKVDITHSDTLSLSLCQVVTMESANMSRPIPETNQRITTETTHRLTTWTNKYY